MLLVAAVIVAAASLAAAGVAVLRARASDLELAAARGRLARLDADLPSEDVDTAVHASALRRDVRVEAEHRAVAQDRTLIAAFLRDYCDVVGADEAIFWRWVPERDRLVPEMWSSPTARPSHFDMSEWAPVVQWTAETQAIQTVGDEHAVRVAAACVTVDTQLIGVLSFTRREGLALDRTSLRQWLPRLATQLAIFHELAAVRRRYATHLRRSQALLDAVQRIQGTGSGKTLARAICETALEVSGARGATLIRWDAVTERGEVHLATTGVGIPDGTPLDGTASVIADVCRSGLVLVLEDAASAGSATVLYGVRRTTREAGSVAIIPLTREDRVLGALVLEAELAGALTQEDMRPLAVLAAVAAGSLELVWSAAESALMARTDPLTGLFNRMYLGEQLQQKLSEADRYGHPVSLVLLDVDHFKSVNDTWGHDAGDAALKSIAALLLADSRDSDVCVRYGGEEIALLLPNTDSAVAVEVAERLRSRIESMVVHHQGAEIAVTASFGVATYPETVSERGLLFPTADKAMYVAKHDGRNCVRSKPAKRSATAS